MNGLKLILRRLLYKVAQRWIVFDTGHLAGDNLFHVGFDLVVVTLDLLLHVVFAIWSRKVRNDRDGFVPFGFGSHLRIVDHDLGMKDFLVDLLPDVIRYGAYERALTQVGNLRGRDQRVELGGDIGRSILLGHIDRLAPLEHLAEPLRKGFGRLAYDLTGKNIANGVLDYFRLLVAVIPDQL